MKMSRREPTKVQWRGPNSGVESPKRGHSESHIEVLEIEEMKSSQNIGQTRQLESSEIDKNDAGPREDQNQTCETLDSGMHGATLGHGGQDTRKPNDGDHLVNQMRQAGSHQHERDNPEDYPWNAPRVILHWIKAVWRNNGDMWQHWTIDNYDGMETCSESKISCPKDMKNDIEFTGLQYRE